MPSKLFTMWFRPYDRHEDVCVIGFATSESEANAQVQEWLQKRHLRAAIFWHRSSDDTKPYVVAYTRERRKIGEPDSTEKPVIGEVGIVACSG